MTPGDAKPVCRLVAAVDLCRADAAHTVDNALAVARCLRADVTLVSVPDGRPFRHGLRHAWPHNAYAGAPDVALHRVRLMGTAAEAISVYARQIGADLLAIPGEYSVWRWFRRVSLAEAVAAVATQPVWILPVNHRMTLSIRLDEDERGSGSRNRG